MKKRILFILTLLIITLSFNSKSFAAVNSTSSSIGGGTSGETLGDYGIWTLSDNKKCNLDWRQWWIVDESDPNNPKLDAGVHLMKWYDDYWEDVTWNSSRGKLNFNTYMANLEQIWSPASDGTFWDYFSDGSYAYGDVLHTVACWSVRNDGPIMHYANWEIKGEDLGAYTYDFDGESGERWQYLRDSNGEALDSLDLRDMATYDDLETSHSDESIKG